MIKILLFSFLSLYILGCSKNTADIHLVKKPLDTTSFRYMYVKETLPPFYKGEKVKVFSIKGGVAKTSKGTINIAKLEKVRSEFQLFVHSPNGTRIRILNIRPKYKDGIWLKPGKYHIEVSAKKYLTCKQWINFQKDTNLRIVLQQKKNISMGFIHWKELPGLKYINGIFWQDMAINKQLKMDWYTAENYCKKLRISINKNIIIDDFRLPDATELRELRKYTARLDYLGSIYWSSTAEMNHQQFAKYVYINKDKSAWYSKNGKTYVRCISRRDYPLELSLHKFVHYLMKHEKYSYLDAYELAVDLKYGKPIVKHMVKRKNHTVKFMLRSQKYNASKNYFYYKNHTTKEKKNIALHPDIKFEIINNKLVFRGIN